MISDIREQAAKRVASMAEKYYVWMAEAEIENRKLKQPLVDH